MGLETGWRVLGLMGGGGEWTEGFERWWDLFGAGGGRWEGWGLVEGVRGGREVLGAVERCWRLVV